MTTLQKEKIKKFVEVLDRVFHPNLPFAKNEKFYDLGIIIREKGVKFGFDDLKKVVGESGKYKFFAIDKNTYENDFLKFLVETLEAKKWPIIDAIIERLTQLLRVS